jgi:hypothetical protein
MTYYKIIGGKRYDRRLLDAADNFTKGRGEFQISLEEIQALFQQANDGSAMTDIEKETLLYIAGRYPLTEKAKKWFAEQALQHGGSTVQMTIQKVLRQRYGLTNIKCPIDDNTVTQYLADSIRNWEAVLTAAVGAFLRYSQGQLSFVARVAQRDGMYQEQSDPTPLLLSYLDRGTLFLIPRDAIASTELPYDLPHVLDSENVWTFVFQTPDFEPIEFFAFVSRGNPFEYSIGQFSKKAGLERTIQAAIRQFVFFNRMQWDIPADEVARQLAILPGQNFGNALFSALNAGIFNQESSFSFGDFIRQEIWPDPETSIQDEMRAYANSGTLYLIPLDYRAQTDNGTAVFPIPEQFSFWMDGEWIFGLDMPQKTNVRFVINTPRDGNDGDTGWINGFIADPLSAKEQLQKVVAEEFKVEGLQVSIDVADFEAQRQQFGPEWRHLPGLLRQALNTMLHDYLSPNGVFNVVVKRKQADIDPTQFDDPKEYRAAIRHAIANYLRSNSFLQMRTIDPDENRIANGETLEQNWLFRAVLQDLADHVFWIVIQRRPDDDQRPYNYIS